MVGSRERRIYLGNDVYKDPEIAAITGDQIHQTVKAARELEAQQQEAGVAAGNRGGCIKLTPEEFVQLQLEKQKQK